MCAYVMIREREECVYKEHSRGVCVHGHSKHILPRHVCGDKDHWERAKAAHSERVEKHPERHQYHEDRNILTHEHIHHANYHAHPHDPNNDL